jgi:hypothetical protein
LEIAANTRKQIVENGGSLELAWNVQYIQGLQHYLGFGQNLTLDFTKLSRYLLDSPHPALGFFLFEPKEFCGLFGVELAKYTAAKKFSTVQIFGQSYV